MPFKKILNDLVTSTSSAIGAILADWEGEAVVQWCLYDEYEIKLIGAHNGIMLNRIRNAHSAFCLGELQEIIISAAGRRFVVGPIGPDYVLVMTLDSDAAIGDALYRFRQAVALLVKEIC